MEKLSKAFGSELKLFAGTLYPSCLFPNRFGDWARPSVGCQVIFAVLVLQELLED